MSAIATLLVALVGSAHSEIPACTLNNPFCKESLAVGDFNFWYFRSYSLQKPNPNIRRAVMVTHGLQRNAGDYFQAVVDALDNAHDPTLLVIAPHFKGFVNGSSSCHDPLEPGELHWSCEGATSHNRWDDGGLARDTGGIPIYSFTMIDYILEILNNRDLFPNLTKITITGHSDGGQFTQRYAAGSREEDMISASVKYVIANPGSYMYLDNKRLPKGETCFEDGCCTARFVVEWDPDRECPNTYNNYKYGLAVRNFGYMTDRPQYTDPDLFNRFISRNVAYLLGENDQLDNSQLDRSCEANAQGIHLQDDESGYVGGRRERGVIFWSRARQLGAHHSLTIVPECGHDEFCIYGSEEMVQALLF